jgi:hypothetical protein
MALWSARPAAYLGSALREEAESDRPLFRRSWNYLPGQEVTVVCYTNRTPVELFLNGKSMGAREGDSPTWTFPFERGKLEAGGREGAADILESTLPAVRIRLSRWEGDRNGLSNRAGDTLPPSAYRLSQVELKLLDEGGRICVQENPLVRFSLAGEGKILGIENGDLSDLTPYSAPRRRVYRGCLIVYVLRPVDADKGRLDASAEGFPPASVAL